MTYDVWMQQFLPDRKLGWGLVAKDLTADEADVYRRTCLRSTHIEESRDGRTTERTR